VFFAVRNLKVTETIKGNIALVFALPMLAERMRGNMEQELFEKITLYKTTMAAVKIMMKNDLITQKEYAEIDTIIAEKYGLISSVIYR